jgi:diguanylate cyclase (GGDEF)-like protein
MNATTVTRASLTYADFRSWAWWKLPAKLRFYVAFVTAGAAVAACIAASYTTWHATDAAKFVLLLGCGITSVAATPRIAYAQGAMVRDFISVWILPIAVLLPPFYAIIAPAPLLILTQMRIHRGVVHRRVFTAAVIGLGYGFGSVVFHLFPTSFAGPSLGGGLHAVEWAACAALCEVAGGWGHKALIMIAVKLSSPGTPVLAQELSRESLHADLAEFDIALLITVAVGANAFLAIVAVPTVLLIRRFMMHAQLLAKSRIDTKTGLLNASTWESEATTEIARCMRASTPISVALIDIDHFKRVNDTHGHLVGDRVLRAMGEEIREQLRSTDIPGRFGGEEFVVLLPNAREPDAVGVAERLRGHVEDTPIPITDNPDSSKCVELTISIGVAALDEDCHELTDLLAAADAALYHAKETGRNKVHAVSATAHKQRVGVTAQADPASALQAKLPATYRCVLSTGTVELRLPLTYTAPAHRRSSHALARKGVTRLP